MSEMIVEYGPLRDTTVFHNISVGSVFRYDSRLYLKTRDLHIGSSSVSTNAITLTPAEDMGEHVLLKSEDTVTALNSRLIVEKQ